MPGSNRGGGRQWGGGNRATKGQPAWKKNIRRADKDKERERKRGTEGVGACGGEEGAGGAPRADDAVSLGADAALRVAAVLREVAAATGEEMPQLAVDGAAGGGVDPRSVDAKAVAELLRKGFVDAAAAAALAATREACRHFDALEGFNEQRRRRVQRAVEWLMVHGRDEDLPAELAEARPKPKPPPPRQPIVRKPKQRAATSSQPPQLLPRHKQQQQQQQQQHASGTAKHTAKVALHAGGWPQSAVAQALGQALAGDALHAPSSTLGAAQAALALLAHGACRMFNHTQGAPSAQQCGDNMQALRDELTAVDAISGATRLAVADDAPLPVEIVLPLDADAAATAGCAVAAACVPELAVRVRLTPGAYPDHVPAVHASCACADTFGGSEASVAAWLALLSRRLMERAVELRGEPMLWELMQLAAELAASEELEGELGDVGEAVLASAGNGASASAESDAVAMARLALDEAAVGAEEDAHAARLDALLLVASGPEQQAQAPRPSPSQAAVVPPPPKVQRRAPAKRPPKRRLPEVRPISDREARAESERMRDEWHSRLKGHAKLRAMRERRAKLPAWPLAQTLADTVRSNRVVVVCGETGCGKSTQLPQFLLEDAVQRGEGGRFNMVVTQPRRIAATGVASRVAQERSEDIGGTIGYSIRLETKRSRKTRVLFCTTGVLLRRLADDQELSGVSVVCVDEVHERSLDSDFLLVLLKDVMARNASLKVVLMSATMDASKFAAYFAAESGGKPCPVLEIPGFTFPVKELYLEDAVRMCEYRLQQGSEYARKGPPGSGASKPGSAFEATTPEQRQALVEAEQREMKAAQALVRHGYASYVADCVRDTEPDVINYELLEALLERLTSSADDDGAVLVFLPGLMEIQKAHEACTANRVIHKATASGKYLIALHSQLSTSEQQRVFENPPPGVRKIALATNIAETSITIDDCTVVIDLGKVKETGYNATSRMNTLLTKWVSQASARQRRGRAGRVRPGRCIRLYSRHRHDQLFAEYQQPEILRVPLDALTLQLKLLNGDQTDPREFLARAVDPPEAAAVEAAVAELTTLGALSAEQSLTPLGSHLALLPVDPRIGKMLVFGALMGCLEPVLTIAAAMSTRSPFVSPLDKRDEADALRKKVYGTEQSDLLASLRGFDAWQRAREEAGWAGAREIARDHFMSMRSMESIEQARRQFRTLLEDARLVARNRDHGSRKGKGGGASHALAADASPQNRNADNAKLVKAVIVAGLYPNVARAEPSAQPGNPPKITVRMPGKKRDEPAALHPSSVCADAPRLDSRYLAFHEMVATSQLYLRDATTVSPYSLLLFGGQVEVDAAHGTVSVDRLLSFRCNARVAQLFHELRARLDAELAAKIAEPESDLSAHAASVVEVVSELLDGEVIAAPTASGRKSGGGGGGGRSGQSGGRGDGRGGGRGGRGRGGGGRGRGGGRGGRGRR